MNVELEEAKVSILKREGVSVAFPTGMSKLQLGLVLQTLAGALIADELEASSIANGNGAHNRIAEQVDADLEIPAAQAPQGDDRLTTSDRRGMPRRRIVKRSRRGKREVLSCGHVIDPVPSNWKRHKSRACEACPPKQ
jgi:hypothetical protein